jgi:NADPH2:quinone reductase
VVITVKGCGVNFPDVLIIQGKYQYKPELPFSPGSEVSGVIKSVGEGVNNLKVGQHVIAFPGWGGFAQEVVADAIKVTVIPDSIDFIPAAGFMLVYGTSYHALKDRAQLQPGETVLVLGAAGGVGLSAIEIAKAMGARVIAAASTDDKLELCKTHGADEVINYSHEDIKERARALTDGAGVDVVYDPVGGNFSEAALRATGWKGRFLVVGFAAGTIPRIPLNLTLLKGCAVVGVFWGDFTRREPEQNQTNMRELLCWLEEGKVRPHVSGIYPLHQAAQGLRDLMERRAKGKIVLTTEY